MPFVRCFQRLYRKILIGFTACLLSATAAEAHFLDTSASLADAVKALRSPLGDHPRILRIEIGPDRVTMEAQDPKQPNHIDAWTYRIVSLGLVHYFSKSGPSPVQLNLIVPDLEANLFDLDEIDFGALQQIETDAVLRAHMEDQPAITHVEIARRLSLFPKPSVGNVRWTLNLSTGRESAEVYASKAGVITGADLARTRYAQTVNLFDEPSLISSAVASFRDIVGREPLLFEVKIGPKRVSFSTNQKYTDQNVPAGTLHIWTVDGMRRQMGEIILPGTARQLPPLFSIDDVDWTMIDKLASDAVAKLGLPQAKLHEIRLGKTRRHPGDPTLEWSIEVMGAGDEKSTVYADAKGAITEVVRPAGQLAGPVQWMDPTVMVALIARVGSHFSPDAKIAEIVFTYRDAHVVVEDPPKSGSFTSFAFTATNLERAFIQPPVPDEPRLLLSDITSLGAARLAQLEKSALTDIGRDKKAYVEQMIIGPSHFFPQLGAKVVHIYVRDTDGLAPGKNASGFYALDGKYLQANHL